MSQRKVITMKTVKKERRKDCVGKSGVYPMSGPHPSGDAPLKGQMEWGQGERGAAGYNDHGGSELSFDSGVVVGGLDRDWPGRAEIQSKGGLATVTEIAVTEWPAFCDWLSRNFRGLETSLERHEDGGNVTAECRNRSLAGIEAHLLKTGVGAVSVTVGTKPHSRVFDICGLKKMRLVCNPAGWPTELQMEHESAKFVLHFTGKIESRPAYTGNSWGE